MQRVDDGESKETLEKRHEKLHLFENTSKIEEKELKEPYYAPK